MARNGVGWEAAQLMPPAHRRAYVYVCMEMDGAEIDWDENSARFGQVKPRKPIG